MPVNAEFALGLTPQKAIDWFAKKQISTANYRDLTAAEHAKSFTVAGMSNLDMLSELKTSLDNAVANGTPYNAWKKDIFKHLKSKGWVKSVDGVTEIFDPETGEYFGGSHRLQRIYRTNMQSALSAQQYQNYKANTDNRPFWRYDAVGDHRTRPAHSALDGLVYAHDDPFWASHYPPNGYNCRCSVTALKQRDIDRCGLTVSQTADEDVIQVEKQYNKAGEVRLVNGVRIAGKDYTPDIGFDYNPGRMNYRPSLDDYPPDLAQAFCVREMSGRDFAYNYARIEQSLPQIKKSLRLADDQKLNADQLLATRKRLSVSNTYAAGVVSNEIADLINSPTRTVWLSDDTLIKQFNSRLNQDFGLDEYATLPDVLNAPEYVFEDKNNSYVIVKDGRLAVIKVLVHVGEIFLQSVRATSANQIEKYLKKLKRIK